jgi:hypothetical protein
MAESWVAMIQGAETRDRLREIWSTMRKYRAEPYRLVDCSLSVMQSLAAADDER